MQNSRAEAYHLRQAHTAVQVTRRMHSGSKVLPLNNNSSMLKSPRPQYHSRSNNTSTVTLNNQPTNQQQEEFTRWVRENIKQRVCCKFVPVEEKKPVLERRKTIFLDAKTPTQSMPPIPGAVPQPIEKNPKWDPGFIDALCHCGYKKSKHTRVAKEAGRVAKEAGQDGSKDWKVSHHTTEEPTSAFGELQFTGYGQRISKYMRVDHMTRMEDMVTLLVKQWKLKTPNLLISVTGGAKNFTMRPRLKEVFRRGLMKAAETTGAWIMTGGMNAGVMKHVGEAVRDYTVAHGNKNPVVAMGISPWGCVNGKEGLIDHHGKGSWPAEYKAKDSQRRQSPLDPNHSHFVLVDNGTQHIFGTEIAFRANLESSISQRMKTTGSGDSAVSIPLVCVVLEGGPGTLETVKSAIQNGTPAVIVEGSGRAADVLAYAYANSYEEEVEATDPMGNKHKKVIPVFDNELFDKVKEKIIAEWKTEKEIDSRVAWVKECLERRDHMTVFQLDGSNSAKDIDLAILQALLKVNKDNAVNQLKLALAWNRIDIAKSDIFTDEAKWEIGDLDEVMFSAIVNDRKAFVELFMENGVGLREFLTVRRLIQLYNSLPENNFLHQLLKKKQGSKRAPFSLADVGYIILDLTGDYYNPLYLSDKYRNLDTEQLLKEAPSRRASDASLEDDDIPKIALPGNINEAFEGLTMPGEHVGFDEAARELFIWSVLNHRLEMAMLFWEEGKEGIAAALTAQKLIKSMRSKTSDSELEKELLIQEEYYGNLAVGVLSECYSAEERRASYILVRELPLFGNSTCVQLAVEADNKKFIAHAACQSLLNSIWMGRMHQDNSLPRIYICMALPFLIFALIKFQPKSRYSLQTENSSHSVKSQAAITSGENVRPQTSHGKQTSFVKDEDTRRDRSGLPWYKKIIHFFNAPSVTFFYNCISYACFLILYTYVLLIEFVDTTMFPNGQISFSPWEILLIVWIGSLLIEEIRQIIMVEASTVRLKFRSYISDIWNILDVIALTTFLAGIILRVIPIDICPNQSCFVAARIIYGINLMTFFFRLLHMFSVHKELGPKLVMIGRMMVDLCFFVVILLVFVAAYGIATQAIMYPGTPLSIGIIKDVLQKPYFQIFGELFLEEIEGELCDSGGPCPETNAQWLVPIMLGVYILITNVLMLNLLIAMFSYTFARVQTNTQNIWRMQTYLLVREYYSKPFLVPPFVILYDLVLLLHYLVNKCRGKGRTSYTFSMIQDRTDEHWKYQRYFLIKEYYDRPPIMPPLILLSHIYFIFRAILQRCCKKCTKVENVFRMQCNSMENRQLVFWENMYADEYLRHTQAEEMESQENKIRDIDDRVENIAQHVSEMAEASLMMQTGNQQQATAHKLPAVLDDRLTYLEDQLQRTSKALNWIIESLVENKLAAKRGRPELPDMDTLREQAKIKKEAVMEKRRREYEASIQRQLDLHVKSRTGRYPVRTDGLMIHRTPVADDKVSWEVEWNDYEPKEFTDPEIQAQPSYADIDLLAYSVAERPKLPFNKEDMKNNVDRTSYCEGGYKVKDGLPLNPKGRTGLCGRGVLGRWGPNHAGDPVVTRWLRDSKGEIMRESGKCILQFVSIQRSDNKEWAIPGGILEDCQDIHECLKAEFEEEAMGNQMDGPLANSIHQSLSRLWEIKNEIYCGYADDPRNTDNAWLETVAINYHDDDGSILGNLNIRAGNNAESVRWQQISSRQPLYGGHLTILQKVAKKHDAAF